VGKCVSLEKMVVGWAIYSKNDFANGNTPSWKQTWRETYMLRQRHTNIRRKSYSGVWWNKHLKGD